CHSPRVPPISRTRRLLAAPPLLPLFFLTNRPPPRSTLFPYTTLFRSSIASSPVVTLSRPCVSHRNASARSAAHFTGRPKARAARSEEHTSELQSLTNLVCRLLLEKKKTKTVRSPTRHSSTLST